MRLTAPEGGCKRGSASHVRERGRGTVGRFGKDVDHGRPRDSWKEGASHYAVHSLAALACDSTELCCPRCYPPHRGEGHDAASCVVTGAVSTVWSAHQQLPAAL